MDALKVYRIQTNSHEITANRKSHSVTFGNPVRHTLKRQMTRARNENRCVMGVDIRSFVLVRSEEEEGNAGNFLKEQMTSKGFFKKLKKYSFKERRKDVICLLFWIKKISANRAERGLELCYHGYISVNLISFSALQ